MYQSFIPLAATAMLAFTMSRWASDELAREGRLSVPAATGATALVVLHALIVLLASAGAVGVVEYPQAVALVAGIPLAVAGGVLTVAALVEAGGWRRVFLVEPGPRPDGPAHRRLALQLYLGWGAFVLGIALTGRSVLALILAVAAALWLWRLGKAASRRVPGAMARA